jgi:hypothetical protein
VLEEKLADIRRPEIRRVFQPLISLSKCLVGVWTYMKLSQSSRAWASRLADSSCAIVTPFCRDEASGGLTLSRVVSVALSNKT